MAADTHPAAPRARLSAEPGEPRFVAAGINHRTASARLRDRVFVEPDVLPAALAALRDAGLECGAILSTCDRTEIWACQADLSAVEAAIRSWFDGRAAGSEVELEDAFYWLTDAAAVRHAMAVASSLDSQVVGEPQVLGQVRDTHAAAAQTAMTNPELDGLFDAAYRTAKRVRSDTRVAERPISIAAAAVRVARDVHGELANCNALLAGDGDMGEALARQLRTAGVGDVTVTAENATRADALAAALDCHVARWDELDAALARADIVVTASTGRALVLGVERVRSASRRRRRPMFLIDAAVPADIDRAVDALDGVYRYDLGDLEQVATDGHRQRRGEADQAMAVVEEEAARFAADRQARDAAPGIRALRAHFEAERDAVLRTVGGQGAAEATRLLINRLLHRPSVELRALSHAPRRRSVAERLIARLFGVGDTGDDGAKG